jgi:uncharacterized protein YutE (UPF0331/DUF86 family)
VLDKDRIIAKLAELDAYLDELRQIAPSSCEDFQRIEKKRSCERLLQLSIECVVDLCKLFVAQLRLGLPSEENDLFKKLEKKGVISHGMGKTLRQMRGFRNILIHAYAAVDDELVFDYVTKKLGDFKSFKNEVLGALA